MKNQMMDCLVEKEMRTVVQCDYVPTSAVHYFSVDLLKKYFITASSISTFTMVKISRQSKTLILS